VSGLASWLLLLIFVASAAVIWGAGVALSDTTDVLSQRLHLGSALGGLILLALATNLPEIAITASAALSGDVSVASATSSAGSRSRPSCSSRWTRPASARASP
jgi:cation:H+ antiporter